MGGGQIVTFVGAIQSVLETKMWTYDDEIDIETLGDDFIHEAVDEEKADSEDVDEYIRPDPRIL